MGYKDIYEKAQKDGSTKELTAQYKEWKDEGDMIVGKFIATNTVASSLGAGTYYQYLFETDEGLVKFALGAIADGEAAPLMKPGRVYAIEFKGKVKISGGRSVNKFQVTAIEPSEGGESGENDSIPF